jgi:iron-sulfur cluster insertion protein
MPNFNFTLTDSATIRINELLKSEPDGYRLRIKVLGGGCSGFQYEYTFDNIVEADDILFGNVIIDSISLGLMENSVLDFVEDLGKSEFIIKNPNTTAKCGCGKSFAV